jgi:hypothetical protein
MKHVRSTIELTRAVQIDGQSHSRTPQTQLLLDERTKLLIEAAKFYPGASEREVARQLCAALSRYRGGRWQRDRSEATCPVQHQGKLVALLWMILKTADRLVSKTTIRRALASREPADR